MIDATEVGDIEFDLLVAVISAMTDIERLDYELYNCSSPIYSMI